MSGDDEENSDQRDPFRSFKFSSSANSPIRPSPDGSRECDGVEWVLVRINFPPAGGIFGSIVFTNRAISTNTAPNKNGGPGIRR